MYKTDKPVTYPDDADKAVWNYEQGTELRDPSGKEVANYYVDFSPGTQRVASPTS